MNYELARVQAIDDDMDDNFGFFNIYSDAKPSMVNSPHRQ